ncbi:DUF5049 domain-containing protein [Plectonema cf. radiosum LEGE 06105]|uniref:DUF5049 domain-containing protein n=1 Tax=Plectonema cf. radiosum LEGE 06105 TaxID=945769 RepID=A0A8J7F153_9CYAN|nr:DUF5049 domain-containing protein [Plectonema radiosum]MBE9212852.1 DUF5049 domain-containing protein [Plectonema cf. radiosum LEGE 06105]
MLSNSDTQSVKPPPSRPYLIPALDAVKSSGQCNMFDSNCVIRVMQNLGYVEQANWLAAHLDNYLDILMNDYLTLLLLRG